MTNTTNTNSVAKTTEKNEEALSYFAESYLETLEDEDSEVSKRGFDPLALDSWTFSKEGKDNAKADCRKGRNGYGKNGHKRMAKRKTIRRERQNWKRELSI